MLGDSFRRLQADELDADWDRLVRGEPSAGGDALSRITGRLDAMIPTASPGAAARARSQLFRDSAVALTSTRSRRRQSAALQSAPLNLPGTAPAKRWWSSPMVALEAVVACLIIAALALGISAYQSNDPRRSSQSFAAAESTPATLPPLDPSLFFALQEAAMPSRISWDGDLDGTGRIILNLSEVLFPVDTGYSTNFIGIHLMSVLTGTVSVTTDSGEPITLHGGESISAQVSERFSIANTGADTAYIVNAFIVRESPAGSFSNQEPAVIDYYPFFLGNAIFELPSEPVTISLEIFDETTINQRERSDGTTLFVNLADPVTFVVTEGDVGIRSPTTSNEEYRTGGGYDPVAIGSTTVLGRDATEVLIQPGTMFTLSAPVDSEALAISLRVESHSPLEGVASPAPRVSVGSD